MNILLCFNEGFSNYGITLIYSIIRNNPHIELNFFILTDKLKKNTKKKINNFNKKNIKITIHNVDISGITGLKETKYLNKYVYLRLLFDQIETIKKLERIIYMDTDMLCLGDISNLNKIDLKNKIIGAVVDILQTSNKKHIRILGVKKYFNSGLMIIDIKKWINNNISEKTIKFIKNNKKIIKFADQDGLNISLENNVLYISDTYNAPHYLLYKFNNIKNYKIIHYFGKPKPRKRNYLGRSSNIYIIYYSLANDNYLYLLITIPQFIIYLNYKLNLILYNLIKNNKKIFYFFKRIYRYLLPNGKKINLLKRPKLY